MPRATIGGAKVVDLFCGVGGLSHGFYLEGFDVSAGVDVDPVCKYPFEKNNSSTFLKKSVSELTRADLEPHFSGAKHKILVGCAPCQPFSTYNQKNSDQRWKLLESFSDVISMVEPDVVSMENVPRLAEFNDGSLLEDFKARLVDDGYSVTSGVLYCPDFGLPQTRSRLVLLASRLGKIDLPRPTHAEKHPTVREAISDLPEISAGEICQKDALHRSSRLSHTNLKRIKSSQPGGTWRDWAPDLRASCHNKESGKTYSSVYGRMGWDSPSPTITTQFFGFGNGRFGHPEQDRAISLREGAILQGFPRKYKFVKHSKKVHMKAVGRMIGNAVPVTLAQAIARTIAQHLE